MICKNDLISGALHALAQWVPTHQLLIATRESGEERTNKGGELSRVVGQPNLVSNQRQQDMVKRELIRGGIVKSRVGIRGEDT